MAKLTREQVEQRMREARERGERPDLSKADLSQAFLWKADLREAYLGGADLQQADLQQADLSGADLREAGLGGADLSFANLSFANLSGQDLRKAYLTRVYLSGANLSGADLSGQDLSGADLSRANLSGANLSRTNLSGADLSRANLSGANLSGQDLSGQDLSEQDLSRANLSRTNLSRTNLSRTNLSEADLSEADLRGATFTRTTLDGTNFSSAITDHTNFIGVDLSQVQGLTEVNHQGPSAIDINAIYQSKDKIPAIFLEKAGVHPDIIRWQHSLHTRPTVFISYSRKDEKEKDELLIHLRALEREDLLTIWHDGLIGPGIDWKQEIKGAIAQASVVILLITPNFLASEFILAKEIPEFLERQKSEEGLIIFPIIAKPCAWSRVSWLEAIQLRPKGGKPIWGKSRNVDAELSKIADEVVEIIKDRWLRRD